MFPSNRFSNSLNFGLAASKKGPKPCCDYQVMTQHVFITCFCLDGYDDPSSNMTDSKLTQLSKTLFPNAITDFGMITDLINMQPVKANSPILFNFEPSSNITSERATQSSKALCPILVTFFGMITDLRDIQ
jgi:hypothetical protein